MAAHRAPPSLGFSRQEHWSGLPFPTPMHESGKRKWSHSVLSDPQRSHGLQPSRLLRPWDFPGKNTEVGCHRLLHTSLTHLHLLHCFCQVKSLSRVQLFATPWTVAYQAPLSKGFSRQECWSGLPFPSSGDLPHCRQTLYHLSHQGSPFLLIILVKLIIWSLFYLPYLQYLAFLITPSLKYSLSHVLQKHTLLFFLPFWLWLLWFDSFFYCIHALK